MNSTSKISKFEQCVRPLLRQNLWVSPSTPSLSPPPVVTTWPTRGFSVHSPKRGKDGPCQPKWRRHGDQDKNQTTPRLFSWIRRAYDPWFPLDYGQGQDYRENDLNFVVSLGDLSKRRKVPVKRSIFSWLVSIHYVNRCLCCTSGMTRSIFL